MECKNKILRPTLNENGMALFASLFVMSLMMVVSVSIMRSITHKNELKRQEEIKLKAANLANKVNFVLNNRVGWAITQEQNKAVFDQYYKNYIATVKNTGGTGLQGGTQRTGGPIYSEMPIYDGPVMSDGPIIAPPIQDEELFVPNIDLYDSDTKKLLVGSTSYNSGFTLDGEVCYKFDAYNGNDDCPFRYEIMLSGIKVVAGAVTGYNVSANLLYYPKSKKYPLNTKTINYSFNKAIDFSVGGGNDNLFLDEAKKICDAIGGIFDPKKHTCSNLITNASPVCPDGEVFNGYSSTDGVYGRCSPKSLVSRSWGGYCGANQYLAFGEQGKPKCADY